MEYWTPETSVYINTYLIAYKWKRNSGFSSSTLLLTSGSFWGKQEINYLKIVRQTSLIFKVSLYGKVARETESN